MTSEVPHGGDSAGRSRTDCGCAECMAVRRWEAHTYRWLDAATEAEDLEGQALGLENAARCIRRVKEASDKGCAFREGKCGSKAPHGEAPKNAEVILCIHKRPITPGGASCPLCAVELAELERWMTVALRQTIADG